MEEVWSVEVKINGESVLFIGHNSLSGIDDIEKYADNIRYCAENLLAFIGREGAESIFAPEPE